MIELYTIQPPEVLVVLNQDGRFVCDPAKSTFYQREDEFNLINAYDWMVEQMRWFIGEPPDGVVIPVWAWYKWGGERVPDMRRHREKRPYCVISFVKDEKEVLLSDFTIWTYVLNNWYFDNRVDIREEEFMSELDRVDDWLGAQDDYLRNKIIRYSWLDVFNVESDPRDTGNYVGRGFDVQATFWELRLGEVVKVKKYGF